MTKRLWCWEGLGAGGEGDDRGWDGWMASLTRWTWVSVNSGRWWWTGRPGMLRFTGSQRVRHDWVTELNWTEVKIYVMLWENICTNKIYKEDIQFSSVQSLSRVRLFVTPWIAARQASLFITISQSSLRHVHRVRDAIQPSHPWLSPSSPALNPSQHQSLFQWVNSSHEVARVLDFQL